MKALASVLAVLLATPLELALASARATLVGSRESMIRQHVAAVDARLAFARTTMDVARLVEDGQVVPVPGNGDYRLKGVMMPFAHPGVRTLIEWLAREYRSYCGEPLVVTSLLRPIVHQPSNAHPLSVHPAGTAVDLRIPDRPECQSFLESMLLRMEAEGLLDVTKEKKPPHLHVAVYPRAYLAYLARLAAEPAPREPESEPAPPPAGAWRWQLGFASLVAVLAGAVAAGAVDSKRRSGGGLSPLGP